MDYWYSPQRIINNVPHCVGGSGKRTSTLTGGATGPRQSAAAEKNDSLITTQNLIWMKMETFSYFHRKPRFFPNWLNIQWKLVSSVQSDTDGCCCCSGGGDFPPPPAVCQFLREQKHNVGDDRVLVSIHQERKWPPPRSAYFNLQPAIEGAAALSAVLLTNVK